MKTPTWVAITYDFAVMKCSRCYATKLLPLPSTSEAFVFMSKSFAAKHAKCKKVRA